MPQDVDPIQQEFSRIAEALAQDSAPDVAAQLHQSMVYLQRMYRHMRQRNAELEEARTSLHAARSQLNSDRKRLKATQAELDKQQEAVEAQSVEAEADLKKLDARIAEFNKQQKRLRQEYDKKTQDLEAETRTHAAEHKKKTTQLLQKEQELTRRSRQLDTRDAQLEQSGKALKAEAAGLEKRSKQLVARAAELDEGEKALRKSQQENDRLASRLDKEKSRLEKLQAELEARQQSLLGRVVAFESDSAKRESDLRLRDDKLTQQAARLDEQKKQLTLLEQRIGGQRIHLRRRHLRLLKTKTILRDRLDRLRASLPADAGGRKPRKSPLVATLTMIKPPGRNARIRIEKPITIVGRDEACDVVVPVPNVSRRHCRLELHDRQLRLRDLQSLNGTLHNGKPVKSIVLQAGDTIAIGPVTFSVSLETPSLDDTVHAVTVPKARSAQPAAIPA